MAMISLIDLLFIVQSRDAMHDIKFFVSYVMENYVTCHDINYNGFTTLFMHAININVKHFFKNIDIDINNT